MSGGESTIILPRLGTPTSSRPAMELACSRTSCRKVPVPAMAITPPCASEPLPKKPCGHGMTCIREVQMRMLLIHQREQPQAVRETHGAVHREAADAPGPAIAPQVVRRRRALVVLLEIHRGEVPRLPARTREHS